MGSRGLGWLRVWPSQGISGLRVGVKLGLLLAGLLLGIGLLPAVAAPLCRTVNGHPICILTIQRSAKYFWEYRAVVTIDDKVRPLEKYDCRHRVRIARDGTRMPFQPEGAGALICQITR